MNTKYLHRYGPNFPGSWHINPSSNQSKTALLNLKVTGLEVEYIGPGASDSDAASIVTDIPVPADCPIYYFEVEVLDKGREGFIGVGFSQDDTNLARLPGWEAHTYGYHGDDGNAFGGSGSGVPYGPHYTTGDVIGVILNQATRTISYTKNGVDLGVAFENIPDMPLSPMVGMKTVGERICANFGATAFQGNFLAIQRECHRALWSEVLSTSLPRGSGGANSGGQGNANAALPSIVFDHLLHHCYSETAGIVARDVLGSSEVLSPERLYSLVFRGSQ